IGSMSIFDSTSLLSRINRNETDQLDIHIARNIEIAQKIHAIAPRYDITVKPLVEAYGFAAKNREAKPNIDSLLEFVGFEKFAIEGNRIVKSDARLQIDLNSIAKGYVVELVAEWLDRQGCENYIVEVGGEICSKGVNSRGVAWRVGVDTPFDNNQTPGAYQQKVVNISGAALATSGNYRRFYYNAEGERISHTLNPQTGASHTTTLLSATVIAPRCAVADGLATAFMASDERDAIALAKQLRDSVQVYFVLAPAKGEEEYREFSTLRE
ncbi:MAG: FAD:protein FMN transferase, partial [Alistipes sp.]|nr:FAD:protein FMN transferase [Alistipes sp.]